MGLLFAMLLAMAIAAGPRISAVDYAPVAMANYSQSYSRTEALERVIEPNLKAMELLIAEAALNASFMVVFPEDGLYGPAFATRASIAPFLEQISFPNALAPCDDPQAGPVVKFMSCAARKYSIYVVLDMGEAVAEEFQYNCAVAFDASGMLVARYRKQHLYFEPQFDQGPRDDMTTGIFETPYGKVGLCICFDALFSNVWDRMTTNEVTFMVAPTWWVNMPPLAVSVGMHSGVARALNTTLVLAGVGLDWYNSGSLVANGKGEVLAQHYNLGFNSSTNIVSALVGQNGNASSVVPESAVSTKKIEISESLPTGLQVECIICKLVVSFVESKLNGNSTLEDVEAILESICKVLPSSLQAECVLIVDDYTQQLASKILGYENEYPPQVICGIVGLCGAQVFTASAGKSGTLGDPSTGCTAEYTFGSSVDEGERFGLLSFTGPYGQPGAVLFNLSTCGIVRCATEKRGCATIYSEGGPIPAKSQFAQLSIGYKSVQSGSGQAVMTWITDGEYKVVAQTGGTASESLSIVAPTTVTSASFWEILSETNHTRRDSSNKV